jgi:hypothetical protein
MAIPDVKLEKDDQREGDEDRRADEAGRRLPVGSGERPEQRQDHLDRDQADPPKPWSDSQQQQEEEEQEEEKGGLLGRRDEGGDGPRLDQKKKEEDNNNYNSNHNHNHKNNNRMKSKKKSVEDRNFDAVSGREGEDVDGRQEVDRGHVKRPHVLGRGHDGRDRSKKKHHEITQLMI